MVRSYLFKLIALSCISLFFFCSPSLAINTASDTYIVNGELFLNKSYEPTPYNDVKKIASIDKEVNQFTDYANGFSILYPNNLDIDTSLSAIRTLLKDDNLSIEIYYDNFEQKATDADSYIIYSNHFTQNTKDHSVVLDEMTTINGLKTHLMSWSRRHLSRIENDKNYYVCAEIVKNRNEVYTILIKSTSPIDNPQNYIENLQLTLFDPLGIPCNYIQHSTSQTGLNRETQTFYSQYFLTPNKLHWGIFEPTAPQDFAALNDLEASLQYKFDILIRYQALSGPVFPEQEMRNAFAHHKYVELTLQTILYVNDHDDDALGINNAFNTSNASIVYDILDGYYDDYFTAYAAKLKEFGHPVLFRLNNEMNGDWCWYSAYYTSKDAQLYNELWKYIYKIFAANGVTNVLWVWNPHDRCNPDFKWNHYLMYYPGDQYVDIIGLTGYNNGTYFPGETWRTFSEIYDPLYAEYDSLFDKPFMITEFGCNTFGGNKSDWINNMFTKINTYPKLKAAIWWNSIDYDLAAQRPGRIYRITDSEADKSAFRHGLTTNNN